MSNTGGSREYYARPAMESIFIQIARDLVEEAEAQEKDWRMTQSLEAELRMQDGAMTAVVAVAQGLEAFINVQASQRLSRTLLEAVEPLGLETKWRVVTLLATGQEWDRGRQPFQDFCTLVKLRNALVHYKPRFQVKPELIAGTEFQSQFTGGIARRYFSCMCSMLAGFFAKAGEEAPPSAQPGAMIRCIFLFDLNDM